ncbi:MAG: hypothetical protein AAGK02_16300 [Pseudomonadota bacterium]
MKNGAYMGSGQGPFGRAELYWIEALRIASATWLELALYLAFYVAYYVALNFWGFLQGSLDLVWIVDLVLIYLLTVAMLRKGGLVAGELRGGFGRYFLISLVSALAILAGMLMLIVPGVMLMIRWLPALGFALAEEHQGIDALGVSWDATSEDFWGLLVSLILPIAMTFGPAGIYLYEAFGIESGESLFGRAVSSETAAWLYLGLDLTALIGNIIFMIFGIAAYSLLREDPDELTEVFS